MAGAPNLLEFAGGPQDHHGAPEHHAPAAPPMAYAPHMHDGAAAAFAQQAAAAAAAAVAAMAAGAQQPAVAPPMMGHLAVGAPAGGAGGVDPAAYGGMAGMGAGGMGPGGMGGHGAGVGGHVEEYVPEEDDGERFCICDRPSFGEMIACDHEGCDIEWFHLPCVDLVTAPKGKWYCPDCTKRMKQEKERKRRRSSKNRDDD